MPVLHIVPDKSSASAIAMSYDIAKRINASQRILWTPITLTSKKGVSEAGRMVWFCPADGAISEVWKHTNAEKGDVFLLLAGSSVRSSGGYPLTQEGWYSSWSDGMVIPVFPVTSVANVLGTVIRNLDSLKEARKRA